MVVKLTLLLNKQFLRYINFGEGGGGGGGGGVGWKDLSCLTHFN